VADAVRRTPPRPGGQTAGDTVELPVHYDGADLDDLARLLELTTDEVVARHTGAEWTVAFCGFAPGFGYLTQPGTAWDVPRRATPRTKVPPGSVALAGEFSGVYPRESPGGWQLIGRTDVAVFDLDRDPAALLRPGTRVRFVEVA
jgi:KipI family sensor histidine kinase inhibitor